MATWPPFSNTLNVGRVNCTEMSLSTIVSTALLNPSDADPTGNEVTFVSDRFTV